ncbi:MAG: TldD/PmbA family protein, partial [Planctomycetota bacterium]
VAFGERQGREDSWCTPYEIDPFEVAMEDKLALLERSDEAMRGGDEKSVIARVANLASRREEQWFASSEGDALSQEMLRVGAGIAVTASKGGVVQTRSYPASFGGNYSSGGYELALAMNLPDHGARVRDEALALCEAEPCPAGSFDLILGGSQLMLQIHESVGHPNEIDRVHGQEVDLAGSSFATMERMKPGGAEAFRYGSDIVNLVADSTVPGGLDTRGYDDDGTPSSRFNVVENGIFTGYHTNREWAERLGELSRGTNRAEGFFSPPMVRITNLSLAPGEGSLDELIASTEDGIFADTVKMWSIDQRRLNFQFTTEIAWRIRNGKKAEMLRDATYQGSTPEFWGSCDAICGPEEWRLWGVPNC